MPKAVLPVQTMTENGAIVGRPRKAPPPDAARRIQQLAAEGRPVVGIAAVFGTTREVLRRWMKESPELQDAFAAGREAERHELHQILLRDARDGGKPNINAMFLLKSRHSYREGEPEESSPRVNLTVNIPIALSKEEYLKTVVKDD